MLTSPSDHRNFKQCMSKLTLSFSGTSNTSQLCHLLLSHQNRNLKSLCNSVELYSLTFCSNQVLLLSLFSVTGLSAPPKTPDLSSNTPLSLQASQSEPGLRYCLSLKINKQTNKKSTLLLYFRKKSMPKSQELTVLLKRSSKT